MPPRPEMRFWHFPPATRRRLRIVRKEVPSGLCLPHLLCKCRVSEWFSADGKHVDKRLCHQVHRLFSPHFIRLQTAVFHHGNERKSLIRRMEIQFSLPGREPDALLHRDSAVLHPAENRLHSSKYFSEHVASYSSAAAARAQYRSRKFQVPSLEYCSLCSVIY